jgi:hypothetical protein
MYSEEASPGGALSTATGACPVLGSIPGNRNEWHISDYGVLSYGMA